MQDFETDVKFNLIKKTPEQCYNVSKTNLKQNLKTARKWFLISYHLSLLVYVDQFSEAGYKVVQIWPGLICM